MIYNISIAYTAANLLLALVLLFKAHKNIIARFYFFCVIILDAMGTLSLYLTDFPQNDLRGILHDVIVFCFSLLPFFFLHFIAIFVRRDDLVRRGRNLALIYFAGLFSYAMILMKLIPEPLTETDVITRGGYLFYVTWHSILFCIGIAILYEHTQGFYGKVEKANMLFVGFALLLLILPGPFTETIFFGIFHLNLDWYFFSCTFAIIFAVYFIFRHKIIVNTIYDGLKSALAVLNDIFIITDELFKIQMARGAVQPLLQYSDKELTGKSLSDIIEQKDLLAGYRDFVVNGKMKESYFDTNVFQKDGERLPMNFSFTPIYTNRELTGFVSVGRSLSELRHSEYETRIFNHAVESSAECVAIMNLQYKIMYVNKAFLDTYGYSKQEIIGESIESVWSRNNSPAILDQLKRGMRDGSWTGELLHVTKQGTEFPVRSITSLIHDEQGVIAGYVSASEDITAKRLSETALKASEARYRALFENVPIGVFQISPTGKFMAANLRLARMLGYDSVTQEFLQAIPSKLFVEERTKEAWKKLLAGSEDIQNMELTIVRDGKEANFLQNIHSFRNSSGQIEYFEGTLNDLTELKKLENELRHSQRMESIGTLAGGIAHDFNNILQIVLVNVLKLRRETGDAAAHSKTVEVIKRSVQRGASLVRQLMTVARKTEVVVLPLNINTAVDELRKLLDQTFPANIELSVKLQPKIPMVLADPTQVHQVLLNLCVNARDVMPNGGQLMISTEAIAGSAAKALFAEAEDRTYVLIKVTDTGTGMDENIRRRIFEPFFTTKDVGQGTGLGLAVVYGIVEHHHGFINVESEVGKGSTFNIVLPANDEQGTSSVLQKEEGVNIPGGTETILLVEDEQDVRETVEEILEEKGYKVITAGDGEEAISIYRNKHGEIHAVVIDMGLPKVSGWHAFLAMKQIHPGVRAIFCSGYLDPDSRAEKSAAGVRAFVQKPYMPDDILQKVRTVLNAVD
jgi:PAS domain S-box-containing protein